MSRFEKTWSFWNKFDPTIESMYLRPNANDLNDYEKREVIGYLPNLKGKKVLDLASGIGRFTRHFSTHASEVVSVDLIDRFVQKNRQDHSDCPNVSYICSDVMDLQWKEGAFDFVFFNWLFLYLEDEEAKLLLDRIHRWLKPGGELFFRESCSPIRSRSDREGYFAHYRTLSEYDSLLKSFTLLKEGHIQAYVDCFSDPFQNFWHCQKMGALRDC